MFVEKARNWQLALPAALTLALAFLAGGFFPATVGLTAGLLCLLLVARITLAERPFAGWSAPLAVTAGAMALFCVWTLASSNWSNAPARALVEFDRALLYVLFLAFMGLHARAPGHLSVLLRWVGFVIAVTCAVSLATRLLPATFPTSGGVNTARLAFPLTYWNALGVFSGLGAILLTHLTASEREPAAIRVAAAAGLPILAVTLYFTFSRGGIAATIVGVVLYMVLSHPRGLLGALPAVGLPVAFALQHAYGAELLAREYYTGTGAREQGRTLLVVLLGCMAAAAALRALALLADRRLVQIRIGPRARRGVFADRGGGRGARDGGHDRRVRPARPLRGAARVVRGQVRHRRRRRPALAADDDHEQRSRRALGLGARHREAASVARLGSRDVPVVLGAASPLPSARDRRPLAVLRDARRARLDRGGPARDRARCPARGRGLPASWPGTTRVRGVPRRRRHAAAARPGRLGLGDARALRLVLRCGGHRARPAGGARRPPARAAAADAAARRARAACCSQ